MAFVTIVVPCAIEPAFGARVWRPARTPRAGASGVVSTLSERITPDAGSSATRSVKVPPTSIPTRRLIASLAPARRRRPTRSRARRRRREDARDRERREQAAGPYDASSGGTRDKRARSDRIRANDRRARRACQRPRPSRKERSMPEFLYRLQPTRPAMLTEGLTSAEREAVAAHLAYLQQLASAGVVLLFGRTQTTDASTFGIVIYRVDSPDEASQIMAYDPVVRAGVMRADVFPFRVVGVGPGLTSA